MTDPRQDWSGLCEKHDRQFRPSSGECSECFVELHQAKKRLEERFTGVDVDAHMAELRGADVDAANEVDPAMITICDEGMLKWVSHRATPIKVEVTAHQQISARHLPQKRSREYQVQSSFVDAAVQRDVVDLGVTITYRRSDTGRRYTVTLDEWTRLATMEGE